MAPTALIPYTTGVNGTRAVLTAKEDDHRVRVARVRRERMSERLLDAAMSCYADHLQDGPPTVDEVIGRAHVSRATFYKYYDSVEEALEERRKALVHEMIDGLKGMIDPKFPAAHHFTMAVYLFLLRGVLDRSWATFISRGDLLQPRGEVFVGLTRHLREAAVDGAVHFRDLDAARAVAIGAMQEVLRAIARDGAHGRSHLEEVMEMILLSLGTERSAAKELVGDVTIYIRGAAPDRLGWWRDPWVEASAAG